MQNTIVLLTCGIQLTMFRLFRVFFFSHTNLQLDLTPRPTMTQLNQPVNHVKKF